MSLFDTLLNQIYNVWYFVQFDLTEAFHQIQIIAEYEHLTAFKTQYDLYQYNVIPFSIANEPTWFQRYLNHTLTGLINNSCIAFFNDILVYTDTHEQMIKHICEVL